MKSAYIELKDFMDIYLKFTLWFDGRFVDVFIWKSVRGLRNNTRFRVNNHLGAYVFYPYRKVQSGLFGEIHLIKRLIGAGYVAHELQHFFYDWLIEQRITRATNEKLALLAGDMTRMFWSEWYALEGINDKKSDK